LSAAALPQLRGVSTAAALVGCKGGKIAHNEREDARALRCHFVVEINRFNFVRTVSGMKLARSAEHFVDKFVERLDCHFLGVRILQANALSTGIGQRFMCVN
jgi:hypothetical protein